MIPSSLSQTWARTCAEMGLDNARVVSQSTMALLAEETQNNSEPIPRPFKDRNVCHFVFHLYLFQHAKSQEAQSLRLGVTVRRRFCKKPLDELRPILLKDMMVPKCHQDSYLLCRTVAPPYTTYGVNTLIEDPTGDVEYLELYNFQEDLRDNPNAFLPMGTTMIIKEPYLKYGTSRDIVSVRCDSPSDVVYLEAYDERLRVLAPHWFVGIPPDETFQKLKENGNCLYRLRRYEESIKYYDRALHIEPENLTIFLNKSAAYLKLHRYWEAYGEAKRALDKTMGNTMDQVKALFRMGKAAYGMRGWALALEHFTAVLNVHPNNKFAPEEIKKVEARIEESQTGKYDMKFLFNESELGNVSLDVADYVGPVRVTDIEGKGKGLVVTREVPKGTLLLVSKAFAHTVYDAPFHTFHVRKHEGFDQSLANIDSNIYLTFKTIRMLRNNPNRAHELYSLFSGRNVDRNEAVPFGMIDSARIELIVGNNSFSGEKQFSSTVIYILPSYINHSCVPNSYKEIYGDVIVIHSSKDLKEGEEITLAYWNPYSEAFQRRLELAFKFEFACECPLCRFDAVDPFCEEREKMLQEIRSIERGTRWDRSVPYEVQNELRHEALSKGLALMARMRDTYQNRIQFRYRLASSLFVLARLYVGILDHRNAIACLTEAIIEHGEFKYEYKEIQFNLALCYKYLNKPEIARQCLLDAYENERILKGIDSIQLFKHTCPLLKALELDHLI